MCGQPWILLGLFVYLKQQLLCWLKRNDPWVASLCRVYLQN